MTITSFIRYRAARVPVTAVSALLLAACAVGPDYQEAPPVDTGSGWSQPATADGAPVDLSAWWKSLGDPVLDRLVTTALSDNLDLRQAEARIREARALRDRAAGGYAPSVGVSGSINRRRQSENGPLPIDLIPGLERDQTIYDAGFDAAWEVDLFGRTRRVVESAEASVEATQADASNARVSVVAEVARNYFTLRGAQRELAAREASVNTLQQTFDLVRMRYSVGDVSQSNVDAAEARLAAAAAGVPDIQARLHAAALGLGVLLRAPPERELSLLEGIPPMLVLVPLPVGERADVLRRRPDVRAAERRLAASTANIGVATAELFPKLSIGAGGGFQSLDTNTLFNSGSQTYSIMPLISWRVFDGGRVRAEIHASEARQQQAALGYEKVVLAALGDAERALSNYRHGLDAVERRRIAVDAARRSFGHAKLRYEAGDIALTDLLTEERVLRDAEDAYARTHGVTAVALVALFKALGGGWNTHASEFESERNEHERS